MKYLTSKHPLEIIPKRTGENARSHEPINPLASNVMPKTKQIQTNSDTIAIIELLRQLKIVKKIDHLHQ